MAASIPAATMRFLNHVLIVLPFTFDALRLLQFQGRLDIDGFTQCAKPKVRVLLDLMDGTMSLGGLEYKIGFDHLFSRNRHFLFRHRTHARMPRHQCVVPGWYVTKREGPIDLRDGIIWIVDGQPPAFHIGMESALHDKNPAAFRHTNELLHR